VVNFFFLVDLVLKVKKTFPVELTMLFSLLKMYVIIRKVNAVRINVSYM
jgi:hypothetical protein